MDIQKYRADYIFHNFVKNFSFGKVAIPVTHSFSSLVFIILIAFLVIATLMLLRLILSYVLSLKEQQVFLEITPPAFTQKTAYTTQQLFSVLHTIGIQRTFLEKLLGKKELFSFEIVSTREKGIRYIIKTTSSEAHAVERAVISYLPQVKVKRVEEYILLGQLKKAKVIEFSLQKHFAFPLAKQDMLIEHDPVAYITGMMTSLKPSELIALQIVSSPVKPVEVGTISQRILHNEHVLRFLEEPHFPWFLQPVIFLVSLIGKVFQAVGWVINDFSLTREDRLDQRQSVYFNQMTMNHTRPARVLSSFEQEAVEKIQEKIAQPLFEATIRVAISVSDIKEQRERIREIVSSLAPFTVPGYQSLKKRMHVPMLSTAIRRFTFEKRFLSLVTNSSYSLLSSSELADLFHFPYLQNAQTENMVKNLSRELPAPLSLKKENNLHVVFAENTYGGKVTPIGLTEDERRRHVYIIGATGTGKSTLMLTSIRSDIESGKGICVIDPHGELAEGAIACIPESRKKDFVYINPDDLAMPIHINLLELTPGLSEEDSLREKEFIAESIVSLFRKIFSGAWAASAHRIEYILRNTIHTAFCLENPTLFTLFDLLNDEDFRKQALTHVTDERLLKFWKNEFGKAGDFQRVKMNAGITSKIGRFLFSPSASRLLEHPKSTIDFDELLNTGKIVICNLAKGRLGEDTSEVLGILILTKIQLAALKRAKLKQNERNDFYVYVDEFQNFATPSFVQMLSEARKYKVSLIMAEQSTSQQKDKNLVHIIIANVGTMICFRTANPEDEDLMLNYFSPYITKGEISNLSSFNFYMKIAAITPQEPFSGRTILIDVPTNGKHIAELIEFSRKTYGVPYVKKEQSKITISPSKTSQKTRKTGAPDEGIE